MRKQYKNVWFLDRFINLHGGLLIMIMVYVTCKDENEAKLIGETLVNRKMAACANFFPIKSIFRWKGEIAGDDEFVLLLKTNDSNYPNIKKEVKKLHSYEVPCILKIKAEANKEYSKWIDKELK